MGDLKKKKIGFWFERFDCVSLPSGLLELPLSFKPKPTNPFKMNFGFLSFFTITKKNEFIEAQSIINEIFC